MTIVCSHCQKPHEACDCPASLRLRDPLVARHRDVSNTIARHAGAAVDRMVEMLVTHRDELIALAEERASGPGARMYGEAAWRRSPEQLDHETFEELADGIFYQSARYDVIEVIEGVVLNDGNAIGAIAR